MKKILIILSSILIILFCMTSCPETRIFKHEYFYIPVKSVATEGETVYQPALSGNSCQPLSLTFDGKAYLNFSGGDEVGKFFDVVTGNRVSTSSMIPNGGKFKLSNIAEFNVSIDGVDNYSITGNEGDEFVFDKWQVKVKTKSGYGLVDYTGTGCEDIVFYAIYTK